MINLNNWYGVVPESEKIIGYKGENEVETRVFSLPGTAYKDYTFYLDIVKFNGKTDIVLLDKAILNEKTILTWSILNQYVDVKGNLRGQIRAMSGDIKKHSNIMTFYISDSLIDGKIEVTLSELEQYEKQFNNTLANTVTAKNAAALSADGAKTSENNSKTSEQKSKTSEQKSAVSEANAFASETNALKSKNDARVSETNSKTSETKSSQALSDLLKMIGVDIATLVGGKIPVEQIPSIATTEIYQADSLAAMNLPVVQNGDICIRTDENKSYIYNNGWVYLSSPTDYASRAGHAETATTAENATMINNHRMAEMSQADFLISVKDPNTYYLVK